MADGEVTVALLLDADNVVRAVRTANGELVKVDRQVDRTQGGFGKLAKRFLAVSTAVALLRGAFRLLSDAVRAAGVQDIAERKLEQALRNTGEAGTGAAQGLKDLAAETQRVSNFGDEAIITAQAMLLSFQEVGGSKGAGTLTKSLVDMAAGLQKSSGETQDLNQIAATLGKSLVQGAGALKRYGISLTDSQEAAFKAAEGLDRVNLLAEIVEANFGGMAAATVDPMRQMENAMGDLSEQAGGPLRDALAQASVRLTTLAQDPGVVALVRKLGAAFGWLVNATIKTFDVVGDAFRTGVVFVRRGVGNMVEAVGGGLDVLSSFLGAVSVAAARFGPIGSGIASLAATAGGAVSRAGQAVDDYAESHRRVTARMEASLAQSRAARAAMSAVIDTVRGAGGAASDAASSTGDLADSMERVERASEGVTTSVDQIRESIEALQRRLEEMGGVDIAELVRLDDQKQQLEADLDAIEETVRLGVLRLRGVFDQTTQAGVEGRGLTALGFEPDAFQPALDRAMAGVKKFNDDLAAERERADQEARAFGQAIESGIASGVEGLAASLGEFAAGAASFGDVGRGIVLSLASLAQQVGSMMIAFGVAALGLRRLLTNPIAAIAAGSALVALGAFAKSRVDQAVKSATGGARSTSGASSGAPPRSSSGRTSGIAAGLYLGSTGALGARRGDAAPTVNNAITVAPAPPPDVYLDGVKLNRQSDETRRRQDRQRGTGGGL